jgi:hypothetical protein
MGLWSWLFGKPQVPIVVSPAPPPTEERLQPRPVIKKIVRTTKSFGMEVVGESTYQDALVAICGKHSRTGYDGEHQATLVLEPSNAYDPNAVMVMIGGLRVGYLAREQAIRVGGFIRAAGLDRATCDARVQGGWRTNQYDEGHYGVRLAVPGRGEIAFS